MNNINDIIKTLTNSDMTNLFVTIYTEVTKCELLENYCGIHHSDGLSTYANIASMLHPVLDEFIQDINFKLSKDVSVFCIDALKDAELILVLGYDISIKDLFPNSPDAIFKSVCYSDDNPNDEPEHPKLSSVIVLAENSPSVTTFTRSQILNHELTHFMFEYMQRILGLDDLVSDIKKDKVLEELLCDMLQFYYLSDHTIKSMVSKYLEYEEKYIKSNLIDNRLDYIKEIQSIEE